MGLPFFFMANIEAARRQEKDGVRVDYWLPGRHLGLHWERCLGGPFEGKDDEVWEALQKAMQAGEEQTEGILAVLKKYYGNYLAVVPYRRRKKFVEGFIDGVI